MTTQPFIARNGLIVNNNILVANVSTGAVGVNTASPAVSLHVFANDAVFLPIGNTGQRPANANGLIRYNTDNKQFEGFANGNWGAIGGGVTVAGPNAAVQFDNSGALGGSANLTYDGISNLSVPTVTGQGTGGLFLAAGPSINPAISISATGNTLSLQVNTTSTVGATVLDNSGLKITKQRIQTVTVAATTTPDLANGNILSVTLNQNITMASPNNLQPGFYTFYLIQDATGSRTITWNAVYKWPGGTAPQLTGTANAKDLASFVCDGTNLYGSFIPDLR